MKVSRTRWKHRSTSARNSAFLVGKRRKRYGWLMPACRATSSVEVPASPCTANSVTATLRTSSRRSAAGILCLVSVMSTKLVMTHYFVKSCGGGGFRPGSGTGLCRLADAGMPGGWRATDGVGGEGGWRAATRGAGWRASWGRRWLTRATRAATQRHGCHNHAAGTTWLPQSCRCRHTSRGGGRDVRMAGGGGAGGGGGRGQVAGARGGWGGVSSRVRGAVGRGQLVRAA